MKLPTSYLPDKIRSAVRFMIVGTTGSFVQTWFFMAALWALSQPEKGTLLYYVAFGIGFVLEMIPNYLFSIFAVCAVIVLNRKRLAIVGKREIARNSIGANSGSNKKSWVEFAV